MQALSTWHSLIQQYSRQPLLSPVVCNVVEDMALALPDLAQGEAAWSPLDDIEKTDADSGSSRDKAVVEMNRVADRVRREDPEHFGALDSSEPETVHSTMLQQEQMSALHQVSCHHLE